MVARVLAIMVSTVVSTVVSTTIVVSRSTMVSPTTSVYPTTMVVIMEVQNVRTTAIIMVLLFDFDSQFNLKGKY